MNYNGKRKHNPTAYPGHVFPSYIPPAKRLHSEDIKAVGKLATAKIECNVSKVQNNHHRRTPEIVEPRISVFDSDTVLRKKVKPVSQNGIHHLPSIDSFKKDIQQASPEKGNEKNSPSKLQKKISHRTPKKIEALSCGCNGNTHIFLNVIC